MAIDAERRRANTRERMARYTERQRAESPAAWSAYRYQQTTGWKKRYPEKISAQQAVYWACKTGRLVRPDQCEECGKACRPEAAHTDYSRKLDVRWLCRQCHAVFDRRVP